MTVPRARIATPLRHWNSPSCRAQEPPQPHVPAPPSCPSPERRSPTGATLAVLAVRTPRTHAHGRCMDQDPAFWPGRNPGVPAVACAHLALALLRPIAATSSPSNPPTAIAMLQSCLVVHASPHARTCLATSLVDAPTNTMPHSQRCHPFRASIEHLGGIHAYHTRTPWPHTCKPHRIWSDAPDPPSR